MDFLNQNAEKDTIATLTKWLENRNFGCLISEYFDECGYKNIAIVDAGEIGKILYNEIKNTDIEVRAFVDRNAEGIGDVEGIPVYRIEDSYSIPEVDIVCISPRYDYEKMSRYLVDHDPNIRTLALKDAVSEISVRT